MQLINAAELSAVDGKALLNSYSPGSSRIFTVSSLTCLPPIAFCLNKASAGIGVSVCLASNSGQG